MSRPADDLRLRLEYLGPLLAATCDLSVQLREVRRERAPRTWTAERVAELVEICDLVELLAWDLHAAGVEALGAHAEESGDPPAMLLFPPMRGRS
jgi:hypothetical protein